jgi:hypothetical protein
MQDLPDVDDEVGAKCSGADPGDNIFRSLSSPTVNVNDLKVSWVSQENLMSNVLDGMVFLDGSWALPPSWRAFVDVES